MQHPPEICSLTDDCKYHSLSYRPIPSRDRPIFIELQANFSYPVVRLTPMLPFFFTLIGRILAWLVNAYITVLIIRMVLDWVSILARNWYPRGIVAQLINMVYTITEPPLRWLRQYIKPLPLGSIYLDMSFIVLYFALVVLESVIYLIF